MLVAMDDQLGADLGDHGGERCVIAQPANPTLGALAGQVDDGSRRAGPCPRRRSSGEGSAEARELPGTDAPLYAVRPRVARDVVTPRSARDCPRQGDPRDKVSPILASAPDGRSFVGPSGPCESRGQRRSSVVAIAIAFLPLPIGIRAMVLVEDLREVGDPFGDVGVVIAGDHGDLVRPAGELVESDARERELLGEREVGDIAGAQHVVDALRVHVLDHVLERSHVIMAAAVRQEIHRADPALVRELEPARAVVRQKMKIGAVREAHQASR